MAALGSVSSVKDVKSVQVAATMGRRRRVTALFPFLFPSKSVAERTLGFTCFVLFQAPKKVNGRPVTQLAPAASRPPFFAPSASLAIAALVTFINIFLVASPCPCDCQQDHCCLAAIGRWLARLLAVVLRCSLTVITVVRALRLPATVGSLLVIFHRIPMPLQWPLITYYAPYRHLFDYRPPNRRTRAK